MNSKPQYVATDTNIIISLNGNTYRTSCVNPAFARITNLIKEATTEEDWNQITLLFKLSHVVNIFSNGSLSMIDGKLFRRDSDVPLSSLVTEWVLTAMKNGSDYSPMLSFLCNVERNELLHVRDELHNWVADNGLPITNDGCFIAYKRVNDDYTDVYTGTIDNSVGNVVSMPRSECSKSNNACSSGYHFGSEYFVKNYYSGDKVVAVKVNPLDVLASPLGGKKGRASSYRVIGEIHKDMKYIKHTIVNL